MSKTILEVLKNPENRIKSYRDLPPVKHPNSGKKLMIAYTTLLGTICYEEENPQKPILLDQDIGTLETW